MLAFLAAHLVTRAPHQTTNPPLALSSIGQSSSLPTLHRLLHLLLPQLGKVPKVTPAVAILLPVQHHPQELLIHPHLLPLPPLLPPLPLPRLELILPTQSPPQAPAQPLLGSSHPLKQLRLPQPRSSNPLPLPPQPLSLFPNPASQAMALLYPL